ncbi:hypothetical protein ACWD6S_14080, partial [Streptomyces zhihengii]
AVVAAEQLGRRARVDDGVGDQLTGDQAAAGGEEDVPATGPDPIVLASGNLALVSFPDVPHRMSREEIDRRHPALLSTLADHPGVGFLLVRSEEHGSLVLGGDGAAQPVAALKDGDGGPLEVFGPGAADAVRRTDSFPHVADIMVNSMFDPRTGVVHAFEEQIGSHGGLGGEQSQPFLLSPLELSPPVAPGETLAGAEQVHRVLRRWLREGHGPQIPLEPAHARAAGGRPRRWRPARPQGTGAGGALGHRTGVEE